MSKKASLRKQSSFAEALEKRSLLATITWDGPSVGNWNTATNWSGDVLPGPGDDVVIANAEADDPGVVSLNSLTLEAGGQVVNTPWGAGGVSLTIASHLTLRSGSTTFAVGGTIGGTGKMTIEPGATYGTLSGAPGGIATSIEISVDNYGDVWIDAPGFVGSASIGPNFHNYGTLNVYGGTIDGVVTNEASGVITSRSSSPTQGSSTAFGRYHGAAAPFVNHGLIKPGGTGGGETGLTPYYGAVGWSYGITIYVDASPTLGGNWHSSRGNLSFASYSSTPATVTFDSTFNLIDGTLGLSNVTANVRGLPIDSGLVISGNSSNVTLVQDQTSLALLQLNGGELHLPTGGNHTLRAQDTRVAASASLDIADNLFIAGNEPGYRQPTAIMVPAPTITPTFAASVSGSLNGTPVAVDGLSSLAVGYSSGAGLASYYASHSFRSESFEDDDFVFFPTLRGDANFDRSVNFDDLTVVAQRFGQNTSRGYADGNFDHPASENSPTNFDDLLILSQNYGQTLAIQTPLVGVRSELKRGARGGRFSDVLV